MNLFEDVIRELRLWTGENKSSGERHAEFMKEAVSWPPGERGNIVLQADTGVELGNPRMESASFIVWTTDTSLIQNGRITLHGPDLPSCAGESLPFGRAVLLAVTGFTDENCHERHREIELARFDLNLRGYMTRAVSQYLREWSRISREAVTGGLTMGILGSALMEVFLNLDYVVGAEVLFVTSSPEDVRGLQRIGERAARLAGAMSKMAEELSFDCGTCDYTDVCSEVDGLKEMRRSMQKGEVRDA